MQAWADGRLLPAGEPLQPGPENLAVIFQGVIFQIRSQLPVFFTKTKSRTPAGYSAVCISEHSFDRLAAFDMLRWISQRYGFALHPQDQRLPVEGYPPGSQEIEGPADQNGGSQRQQHLYRYADQPVLWPAVAQVIQLGISVRGKQRFAVEFSKVNPDNLDDIVEFQTH